MGELNVPDADLVRDRVDQVVRLGEASDRPTGGTYHITWSLGPGREAIESNAVIAAHGWQALEGAASVGLEPASWG